MILKIKSITLENFKGIKKIKIDFGGRTTILGRNAAGKTTIMDGFMWLLFNRDGEGRSNFNIRPNDRDGRPIDNVVISASAVLEVDGKEALLTKTQEQNWVKKRGSEVSQLQGNVNVYEINEIPKTEKDYKAYIGQLMDEGLFELVTSPQTFTSMAWKDQRAILLKLISEVTDQDAIDTDGKFRPLSDKLKEFSVDDLTVKAKKALKELNKKQAELPARVDEANKGLVEVDFPEYEFQKADLERRIDELEKREGDVTKAGEEGKRISDEIIQTRLDLNKLEHASNEASLDRRNEIQRRIDDAGTAFLKLMKDCEAAEKEIQGKEVAIEQNRVNRETLLARYKEVQAMELDSSDLCCPLCGQSLPTDRREEKTAEFRKNRERALEKILKDGKQAAANIAALEGETKALETRLEEAKTEKVKRNKEKTVAMEELEASPLQTDATGDPEYQALSKKIRLMTERLGKMGMVSGYLAELKKDKAELVSSLDEVKAVLAGKEGNQRVRERVAELQKEQRANSQLIADQEKDLCLLEEFTRAKMDLLTSRIDEKFKLVSFRLFETQINGGYRETCECMVDGVPFGSLNSGHRVMAGLDIIATLQDAYGVTAPIFIDGAESINDFNIPDMPGQFILLKVAENKKIKVEAENEK